MKQGKISARILSAALTSALLVVFTSFWSVSAEDMQTGKALNGTAVIDGANTNGEWDAVPSYPVIRCMDGSDTGTTGSFQMMWDGNYIYMLVQSNDSTVSDTGEIDNADNIQIYIDPELNKNTSYSDTDYQWEITRSGKAQGISDAPAFSADPELFTNNCEFAVTSTATSWICEYKVNLAAIHGSALTAETIMGLDVQVNDCDTDSGSRLAAYGWNDSTNGVWGNPSLMGEITLSGDSAVVKPAETAAETAAAETAAPDTEAAAASPQTGDTALFAAAIIAVGIISAITVLKKKTT
jgi:Domain of unknown function (DUF1083).